MIKGIITTTGQITGVITAGQGGGGGSIEPTKTVTPTDDVQVVEPSEGYDGLRSVIVEAIPSNYGHIAFNGSYLRVY